MKEMIKYSFIALFLLSMFSFVLAVPPVTTVPQFTNGYIIAEAQQEYLELNHDYAYHFYLYNASDGKIASGDEVNCTIAIANNYGEILTFQDISYIEEGTYWEVNITGGNFSYVGEYSYGINCQNSYGGALAGTFEVTPDGRSNSFQILAAEIILIIFILLIILSIKRVHGGVDFKDKQTKLINSDKNMGQKMAAGLLTSLFKNSFVWIYSLGWFIIFILKDIVHRFSSIEIFGYFELFANIYSLGFLLVVVYMIGYTISYMNKMTEVLTDNNWGVGD